jgi:hypothetical protein
MQLLIAIPVATADLLLRWPCRRGALLEEGSATFNRVGADVSVPDDDRLVQGKRETVDSFRVEALRSL